MLQCDYGLFVPKTQSTSQVKKWLLSTGVTLDKFKIPNAMSRVNEFHNENMVTFDKFKIPNAMSRVKEFHNENIYLQSFII